MNPAAALRLLPLALILAAYALGAAWFAGWLRAARGVRVPYTRKLFHVAIFSAAAAADLVAGLPLVIAFGLLVAAMVLVALVRGEGDRLFEALARPSDAPHRRLLVLVPLLTTAAGGLAAALLFGRFAAVGYLVGGWGDAVGEPVGARWGRHRYRVPSLGRLAVTRSLEGSAAVALVSAAAAAVALVGIGEPLPRALPAALLCAAAATAVEAVSHHGLDNVTIQVAAAGTAAWLLG